MAHGVIALHYLYVKVQQGDVMSCLSDFTFLRCDFVQHLPRPQTLRYAAVVKYFVIMLVILFQSIGLKFSNLNKWSKFSQDLVFARSNFRGALEKPRNSQKFCATR